MPARPSARHPQWPCSASPIDSWSGRETKVGQGDTRGSCDSPILSRYGIVSYSKGTLMKRLTLMWTALGLFSAAVTGLLASRPATVVTVRLAVAFDMSPPLASNLSRIRRWLFIPQWRASRNARRDERTGHGLGRDSADAAGRARRRRGAGRAGRGARAADRRRFRLRRPRPRSAPPAPPSSRPSRASAPRSSREPALTAWARALPAMVPRRRRRSRCQRRPRRRWTRRHRYQPGRRPRPYLRDPGRQHGRLHQEGQEVRHHRQAALRRRPQQHRLRRLRRPLRRQQQQRLRGALRPIGRPLADRGSGLLAAARQSARPLCHVLRRERDLRSAGAVLPL